MTKIRTGDFFIDKNLDVHAITSTGNDDYRAKKIEIGKELIKSSSDLYNKDDNRLMKYSFDSFYTFNLEASISSLFQIHTVDIKNSKKHIFSTALENYKSNVTYDSNLHREQDTRLVKIVIIKKISSIACQNILNKYHELNKELIGK